MACDFSLKHYREMLKKAQKAGFVFSNFCEFDKKNNNQRLILLRHDIDYSPKRALMLAKIEKDLGIRSTFFVRVHGEHYHPFDQASFPIIRQIIELGHEIGLHYEARTLAQKTGEKDIDLFRTEKQLLETIFKIKIESCSEHRDLGGKTADYRFFCDKRRVGIKAETYEKRFQDFYLADSCGRWNNNCLCQNLDQPRIQLLVHPDLWGEGALKEVRTKIRKIGLRPTY